MSVINTHISTTSSERSIIVYHCVPAQDFTGIDTELDNLVSTGQSMTQPPVVLELLKMVHTAVENHTVNMRPRDLRLVIEGIVQLTR